MIAVLRIVGQAGIRTDVEETLKRLCMHRKLVCTFVNQDDAKFKMVYSIRDFIAYGEISDELAQKIIESRGQTLDGKPVKDAAKVLEQIKKGEWKIKKFFRMHPPRGGFKKTTKLASPKGILGHNKEISKLLERML